MTKTKCAIYARVSTDKGAQTTENQLGPLIEYCNKMNWTYQIYEDQISSSKYRPNFQDLMFNATQRKFDVVLTWKIDRLSRSVAEFSQTAVMLDKLGIRLIVLTQGIDTDKSSPASSLLMNVLMSFAQFERELIVERVKAGIERRKKQGKPIGGATKRVVIDAEFVREMYMEQGYTIRQIAKKLDVSHGKIGNMCKQFNRLKKEATLTKIYGEIQIPDRTEEGL